mgnify:CR=1 FL=1
MQIQEILYLIQHNHLNNFVTKEHTSLMQAYHHAYLLNLEIMYLNMVKLNRHLVKQAHINPVKIV